MTTSRKAQPVPASLDDHGKALWRSIASKYELRPDDRAPAKSLVMRPGPG